MHKAKIYPMQTPEDKETEYNHVLYFDGGSRGNPGPGGAGYALFKDGIEINSDSIPLGKCTNNYAEYAALIIGLQYAVDNKLQNLLIRGDSLLVIRHCQGKWKIKSEQLRPLYAEAKQLLNHFESVELEHVKRDFNKRADQLANKGIDQNTD